MSNQTHEVEINVLDSKVMPQFKGTKVVHSSSAMSSFQAEPEEFEGGKVQAARAGTNWSSRQQIAYDDDESGSSDGEEEVDLEELQDNNGLQPNAAFKSYKQLFRNLTTSAQVVTMYPIVTCMISYDSSRVITVTKKDDTEFWVRMYNPATAEKTFNE